MIPKITNYFSCFDSERKMVNRIYDWDGKLVQFSLCEKHCIDPDFFDFVSETSITCSDVSYSKEAKK